MSVSKFVAKHLKLLDKERDAEIEETRTLTEKLPAKELQRRGVCLLKLQINGRHTGLYGRLVISFEPGGGQQELPSHNITPGDIVSLSPSSSDSQSDVLGSGIVTRASKSAIYVAFDDKEDLFTLDDEDKYKLMKLANDVTYKRLKKALNNLDNYHTGPSSRLISVLFDHTELSPPYLLKDIHFVNKRLDDSQKEAVVFALSQPEIAVVHGPPGTGKTTTVIEIIIQAVKQGQKVLACAPSNIAVDNLVERLVNNKQKVVRLGHPARVLPHIQRFSLDAILASSDETKVVEDVRRDLDKAFSKLKKTRDKGERQKLREERKFLRKELVQREEAATKEILKRADVVLATLTSATGDGPMKLLDENHFNLTVIDECSQAVEASCWIPLLRAPKCILAGDHLQLPPTILSKEAANDGLETTLMERVLSLHHQKVMKMLTVQYRMHRLIMQWSSVQLYHSKLKADASVEGHLLCDLPKVEDTEETREPLLLVDTAGCELYELDVPEEISKGNEGEADIVSSHVEKLVQLGLEQEDIAVIAPYNLQVELLRLRLSANFPKVEIKSVDGFQGREKEAVIISLVRSNPKGEVGFLAEKRRINVAITRARRHLVVVCDSETVSHDEFLKSLIDYMSDNGEVRTAQEYIDDGIVNKKQVRPEHLNDLLTIPSTARKQSAKHKTSEKRSQDKKREKESKKDGTEPKTSKPENRPKTEEETNEKIDEFQKYLDRFVSDPDHGEIEFPTNLNSHDRLLVHELSEKMGLCHVSKGVGKERHIVVSKPGTTKVTSEESNISHQVKTKTVEDSLSTKQIADVSENSEEECAKSENSEPLEEENLKSENHEPKKSDKLVCRHCSKSVIQANFTLHETHCARMQREKSKAANESKLETENQRKSAKGTHKPTPNAHSAAADRLNKVDSDDFDALIAAAQSMDKGCSFKKCKAKTLTLGQICKFCVRRFCLNHHMPEVHGCGDAAKADARATISKEGVLYRGSGVPSKLPNAERKAQLQKKMDKKLSDLTSKRQGKKSKK